ncbi:receptor binding tail protein [Yersinia phage phiR2-01]|uniref:Receptor-binding tail protein n=1 Tax=Yersinia phage phiR2-01 TaxID=1206557 RepID=I7LEH0_9CAUD|nr:receptor binding tail protein [Yersinia phage phiR2-01]CCI88572.1 receptor-binding tail protein [Yersinia phage phiR2-01]
MSIFVGRLGGKSVLSLNAGASTDTNVHINPNADTIFHSDMPFVLVDSTHESALTSIGNGFYVCQMPADIASLKSNDSGRVILTAIEINGTHTGFLNGTQSFVGQTLMYGNDEQRAYSSLSMSSGFASGSSLAHGTYQYISGRGHEESIARNGTGGTILQVAGANIFRPGGVSPGETISICYTLLGFGNGTIVPINASNPNYWNPNWQSPIGAANMGHDWFYVCSSNIRGVTANYGTSRPGNTDLLFSQNATYTVKGSSTNLGNQGTAVRRVQDSYPCTPTKVIWYVLNLKYSDGTMNVAGNPFTGTDIILSPKDFTIKGVKLRETTYKFINQNSFGSLTGRPDMEYIGSNSSYPGVFGDTTGRAAFNASNNGSIITPVSYGGRASQLSIYKFNASKEWYMNTKTTSIGNENGEVWSPRTIPLRLLANNVASSYIGDDINPLLIASGDRYTAQSSVYLGIPNRDTTVILTIEVIMGNINSSGLMVGTFGGTTWPTQGRKAISYTGGDGIFHQILTLPPGELVPFHSTTSYWNTMEYSNSSNMVFMRGGLNYTIKNLGNGYVELGVVTHFPRNTAAFIPRFRVTIQRLT